MDDRESRTADTGGSLPPEKVEDRPNVGSVKPADYPDPAGTVDPRPLDEDKESERLAPGNAGPAPGRPDHPDHRGKGGEV